MFIKFISLVGIILFGSFIMPFLVEGYTQVISPENAMLCSCSALILFFISTITFFYDNTSKELREVNDKLRLEIKTLRTGRGHPTILSEGDVVNALKNHINNANTYELTKLSDIMFGGKLKFSGTVYQLHPNPKYQGAYDYLSWS